MILDDIKIMLIKGAKGDKGEGSYDDSEIRQLIRDEATAREQEIAELEARYLEYMYPVGSIYISVNDSSPQVLFGGTWEKIEGKFLLSSSTSHEIGSTGGTESNSYTPSGTVGNHTLTVNEIPSHNHPSPDLYSYSALATQTGSFRAVTVDDSPERTYNPENFKLLNNGATGNKGGGQAHNHGFTGNQATLDNMPPYLTVNVWKRTA